MNKGILTTIVIGSIAYVSMSASAEDKPFIKSGTYPGLGFNYQPTAKEKIIREQGLTTLVAAFYAADLVDTLRADGPYTLFAPNNDAFAKLPQETLQDLFKPENKEKLKALLSRHVVMGEFDGKAVSGLESVKTLSGDTVKVSVVDGKVKIASAKVVTADITGSNGVVHVIDTVLLP